MARSGGDSNLFCVVPVHGFSEPGGIRVNFDYHISLWEKVNCTGHFVKSLEEMMFTYCYGKESTIIELTALAVGCVKRNATSGGVKFERPG